MVYNGLQWFTMVYFGLLWFIYFLNKRKIMERGGGDRRRERGVRNRVQGFKGLHVRGANSLGRERKGKGRRERGVQDRVQRVPRSGKSSPGSGGRRRDGGEERFRTGLKRFHVRGANSPGRGGSGRGEEGRRERKRKAEPSPGGEEKNILPSCLLVPRR
jgi:hypothetical protein